MSEDASHKDRHISMAERSEEMEEAPCVQTQNIAKITITECESEITDLRNKMGIVYNVLKACIKEQSEKVYYYQDQDVKRLAFLTNLPQVVCDKIYTKTKQPELCDTFEVKIPDTSNIDMILREILVKYYVDLTVIPKINDFKKIAPDNCNFNGLNKVLKRNGYVWRRLRNTKRVILMEHPKQTMERQRYLLRMNRYREQNRNIVYVEDKVVDKGHKYSSYFKNYLDELNDSFVVIMAIVYHNELIGITVSVCKSIAVCQKFIEEYFIKNILPLMSEPSVIVMEDKPYFSKSLPVPTIDSEKQEMIGWLTINSIPHDHKSHRSELYDLIQKCKNKCDLHKFDQILRAHGHEVVRRPPRANYLNYYNLLWKHIPSTGQEPLISTISQKNKGYWKSLEHNLIAYEKTVFSEDLEIENKIDKILTMANNVDVTEWANAECESAGDSLEQEGYVIENQNYTYCSQNTFQSSQVESLLQQEQLSQDQFRQALQLQNALTELIENID